MDNHNFRSATFRDGIKIGVGDLTRLRQGRVVVVGDVILDHYVTGTVSRVSPEAPVPVLRVLSERSVAGGAANVAANVATLGGHVELLGVVGDDHAAKQLRNAMAAHPKLNCQFITDAHRPTPIKTRYIGDHQQIVRVDQEDDNDIDVAAGAGLLAALQGCIATAGVVILSDYAKGMLTRQMTALMIACARKHNVPVLVDPKQLDLSHYAGATIITPNRKELEQATGLPCGTDSECLAAASLARARAGADILLTRSEQGMSFFGGRASSANLANLASLGIPASPSFPVEMASGATDAASNDTFDDATVEAIHMPTQAREVFDVSGAGDTVMAAFGLAISVGLSTAGAMQVANAAAGLTVAKQGTATVSHSELTRTLLTGSGIDAPLEIFADAEDLASRCREWRNAGHSIGFANGCFDLVHPGHIRLINSAAGACDRLVVALNSDASVKRLKGADRPLQDESARAEVMASLKGVAAVTFFDDDTPMSLIRMLQPDVIIKGSDYTEDQVVGGEFVKSTGGRVHLVDLKAGHSTTKLALRARSGLT
jgi:D-beta-D-heptose 7-phosphate kinase/D-beta-D-heptose 1-phosphate adenosyltransferase